LKSKVVWLVAALLAAPLFQFSAAYAGFLDELKYNSGSTQTYGYSANRRQVPADAPRTVPPQQAVVGRQLVAPRVDYQQPMVQNRANAQQVQSYQVVSKNKPVRRSVKAQAPVQRRQVVRSHQPGYAAQPRTVFPQTYNQLQAPGYYANRYQPRYVTAPNYYQGYSYNSWGSSGQACAPGRS
jgi:hypothetical protein